MTNVLYCLHFPGRSGESLPFRQIPGGKNAVHGFLTGVQKSKSVRLQFEYCGDRLVFVHMPEEHLPVFRCKLDDFAFARGKLVDINLLPNLDRKQAAAFGKQANEHQARTARIASDQETRAAARPAAYRAPAAQGNAGNVIWLFREPPPQPC